MNKEQFLAMSLPYGIEMLRPDYKITEQIYAVSLGGRYQITDSVYHYNWYGSVADCMLILHPLYDLTKEIEHKGEMFVPIERIKESQRHLFFRTDIENPVDGLQFSEVIKLIEWHFDICGLIEKGEAIDVNTLNENPYK